MAYLQPSGHNNSSLGEQIFTKLGTHMLQTMTKDEFDLRGRTYFPDFSSLGAVQMAYLQDAI